eukprot:TRINITY_DN60968_c0_g1_i1.p1 TRINITY_DN60968_c0_g1~~TRINITY_DN60968_c0_g1_i1.p1  ORF type:complete len:473 (-),score=76.24 TRINITY_DN60968_c0_g1_i1:281-1699(-)
MRHQTGGWRDCPQCDQSFTHERSPMLLSCGHHVCAACLDPDPHVSRIWHCPLGCPEKTCTLTPAPELLLRLEQGEGGNLGCDNCEADDPACCSWCEACNTWFCADCRDATHLGKAMSRHHWRDPTAAPACPTHHVALEQVCTQCEVLCCADCTDGHSGHNKLPLAQWAHHHRRNLASGLKRVAGLGVAASDRSGILNAAYNALVDPAAEQQIREQFRTLREALGQREEELLAGIAERRQAGLADLQHQLVGLATARAEARRVLEIGEGTLQCKDGELLNKLTLSVRLIRQCEAQWPSLPTDSSPPHPPAMQFDGAPQLINQCKKFGRVVDSGVRSSALNTTNRYSPNAALSDPTLELSDQGSIGNLSLSASPASACSSPTSSASRNSRAARVERREQKKMENSTNLRDVVSNAVVVVQTKRATFERWKRQCGPPGSHKVRYPRPLKRRERIAAEAAQRREERRRLFEVHGSD